MDLIGELLAGLDTVTETLAGLITDSPLTYAIVFGLVALDVLFPILPAEASVLVAAVLAGSGQLSLAWVVVAGALGAFVGDNVAYWIGRKAARPLVERLLGGHAERLAQVRRQFHDRGSSFIIVGRFVPGGRTAVAVGAGVLHYPWSRFLAYDVVAAGIWSLQAAIPGYIGGVVFADRPWIGLAIGIVLAVLIAVTIEAIRRANERRRGSRTVDVRSDRGSDVCPAPTRPVPGERLDGRDPQPCPDGRPQQAVVTQAEDRAGAHERIGGPGPDDGDPERDEGVPADAAEDDEVGARLERAHEDR
jgi:membrane protein DedA with SNARE-associated domain